jgi:hypothetical protein
MTQPDDTGVSGAEVPATPPPPPGLPPTPPVPPMPPVPPVPPEGSALLPDASPVPPEGSAPVPDAGPGTSAVPPVPPVPPEGSALLPDVPAVPLDVPRATRPGRVRRAVLRWTAAALVFGAFGTAAAYAVTQPDRTRIPGLTTPGDGRWAYPTPTLPLLPAGSPRPLAEANDAGRHYADLRSLLLPLPKGAVEDRAVRGDSGWVSTKDFAARASDDPDLLALDLKDHGLRHIAGEGWTTPDHVRTQVYLLQFISAAYATSEGQLTMAPLKGADSADRDTSVTDPSLPSTIAISAYGQPGDAPGSTKAMRYAWIESGDTVALVVQSGADPEPEVPFRQTVRLQAQLLG